MRNKLTLIGVAALMIIGLVATSALAMPFGFGKGSRMEQNEDVIDAIESEDYDAYMEAIENEWITYRNEITEDRFNEMVEIHEEREALRAEMDELHEAVVDAIEQGDYDAWVDAHEALEENRNGIKRGNDLTGIITEDNFEVYAEMHEARVAGDYDTVRELREELGIEVPMGGFGQGMGRDHKGMGSQGFGRGMGQGHMFLNE